MLVAYGHGIEWNFRLISGFCRKTLFYKMQRKMRQLECGGGEKYLKEKGR